MEIMQVMGRLVCTQRVDDAISIRYGDLMDDGLLHTFLTVRDRDQRKSAEVVGSSLDPSFQEEH